MAQASAGWMWQRLTRRPRGPAVVRGLVDTAPLREFLGQCLDLDGIDIKLLSGTLRAVALSAISYSSGNTVTFVQGRSGLRMWERAHRAALPTRLTIDHVMASAAVPIIFPAIRMGDEFFGDGSVGASAPLAPAIHMGARGILAIGVSSPRRGPRPAPAGDYPSAAEVMGLLFRAIFVDGLVTDAERLERTNQLLAAIPDGAPVPAGLAPVELLVIRPSRNLSDLVAGRDALLPASMRRIVRAIGGTRAAASEFLAYLLFHPEYTTPLAELGYDDVGSQWPLIERFFARLERQVSE
jgi:NTE family protein